MRPYSAEKILLEVDNEEVTRKQENEQADGEGGQHEIELLLVPATELRASGGGSCFETDLSRLSSVYPPRCSREHGSRTHTEEDTSFGREGTRALPEKKAQNGGSTGTLRAGTAAKWCLRRDGIRSNLARPQRRRLRRRRSAPGSTNTAKK